MEYLKELFAPKKNIGNYLGSSIEEINLVQNEMKLIFPKAYIEFLRAFGNDAGYLLKGYYTELKYLEQNKKEVEFMYQNIVSENKIELPSNILFFANWQGYNFFFFKCGVDDDPPVKILNDSFEIINYKKSFTSFLIEEGLNNL